MVRYETLVLAIPELTADEAATLEKNVEKTLVDNKASLISYEKWGKYRLAYPIERNDYGVYFLVRYEVAEAGSKILYDGLHTLLSVKHNELVMRHMTCSLDANAPLSYHRPESLEETPTRDVDTFLKESKMTGLLNNRSDRGRDRAPYSKRDEGSLDEDMQADEE